MLELEKYQVFTKPAELHKAVNTLRGIVAGISADAAVSGSELNELTHWCELHANLRDRHPFSELLPVVEEACADGVVTDDEAKDILWICNNFVDSSSYYNATTASIQFLSGLIHGIMADGDLSDSEIHALKKWIDANEFLNGTYPFDEICTMIYTVLADGKITEEEKEQLTAFFANIIDFTSSFSLVEKDYEPLREKYNISGICSISPQISFQDRTFCFTGESRKAKRADIAVTIASLGGALKSAVSSKTDFLIVGDAGNPCWAYACYGRKIEEAMTLRKNGGHVVIVHEADFWDAIEDALAGIE